jgi:hypothetical protein
MEEGRNIKGREEGRVLKAMGRAGVMHALLQNTHY